MPPSRAVQRLGALALAAALAGCAQTGGAARPAAASAEHPEARAYRVSDDAAGEVDAALARARLAGKRVLLVMGANWCHDSRALAGWLESARFAPQIARHFEVVYVNVGMPQTGDGHNLQIARRFGIEMLEGTPTLLVLDAEGRLLNAESAAAWRNAASRSGEAILAELMRFAREGA